MQCSALSAVLLLEWWSGAIIALRDCVLKYCAVLLLHCLAQSAGTPYKLINLYSACAGFLFIKAINAANKDFERQDKIDGY